MNSGKILLIILLLFALKLIDCADIKLHETCLKSEGCQCFDQMARKSIKCHEMESCGFDNELFQLICTRPNSFKCGENCFCEESKPCPNGNYCIFEFNKFRCQLNKMVEIWVNDICNSPQGCQCSNNESIDMYDGGKICPLNTRCTEMPNHLSCVSEGKLNFQCEEEESCLCEQNIFCSKGEYCIFSVTNRYCSKRKPKSLDNGEICKDYRGCLCQKSDPKSGVFVEKFCTYSQRCMSSEENEICVNTDEVEFYCPYDHCFCSLKDSCNSNSRCALYGHVNYCSSLKRIEENERCLTMTSSCECVNLKDNPFNSVQCSSGDICRFVDKNPICESAGTFKEFYCGSEIGCKCGFFAGNCQYKQWCRLGRLYNSCYDKSFQIEEIEASNAQKRKIESIDK